VGGQVAGTGRTFVFASSGLARFFEDGVLVKTTVGDGTMVALRSLRVQLKHWLGLDSAIAFTVMTRFWSATAGIVTVLLIAQFLTPKEQGYYYTFSSPVALQIVFECARECAYRLSRSNKFGNHLGFILTQSTPGSSSKLRGSRKLSAVSSHESLNAL